MRSTSSIILRFSFEYFQVGALALRKSYFVIPFLRLQDISICYKSNAMIVLMKVTTQDRLE